GRGAVSRSFWRTMEQLFNAVEIGLARFCAVELDVGTRALHELFPSPDKKKIASDLDGDDLDGRVNEAKYRARWGKWLGRELAFYAEAMRLVEPLEWSDVVRVGGAEALALSRMARAGYDELTRPRVPERLRVGSLQIRRIGAETTQLTTYTA